LQVIGVFTLAEVLVPLRETALLNVFDRNLLPTFLVVSGTIFSNASGLGFMHISKWNLSRGHHCNCLFSALSMS
jgi:hypothetical protein